MVNSNISLLLMIATLSDGWLHPSLQVAECGTVQKLCNSWLRSFTEGLSVGFKLWDMGGPENKEKRKLHCVPEYGVQAGITSISQFRGHSITTNTTLLGYEHGGLLITGKIILP